MSQLFAHGHNGLGNGAVVLVMRDAEHKTPVNFQGGDGEFLEVSQTRIARAEIVKGQAKPLGDQFVHDRDGFFRTMHEQAFRNFQAQQFAGHAVTFRDCLQAFG